MGNVSCILLSGGIGTRMKLATPKQFLLVGGKPLLVHVLERIDTIEEINEIIIPSPKDYMKHTEEVLNNFGFSTPIRCIEGGATRQESVCKGLLEVSNEQSIIHEAVRPFVTREEFVELIQNQDEAAIFGLDIPFTVLGGNDYIEENLERNYLINVQLPQRFPTEKLLAAHLNATSKGLSFTDDASLYFDFYKSRVKVIKGSEYNLKITNPIDRNIAEVIYKEYILGGNGNVYNV
ncbi:IspD/TarI family cytidylyltransferase [Aquibacillus saliphilus]|uniref:IspD/TarI family cytidylyltransferase n=1 Tax=Aquibacillus saliphilus TaxID=1909422 RepID=UPI001CF05012|nr:2-C-methyl-D-erythritol 4-phosphate cytidylyltransferase [Aquibacillus saliphilus]